MNKKRVLSIAASAVLAGTIFTGCGWNDDDSTTAAGATADQKQLEDGLIVRVPAGKMLLLGETDSAICTSNVDLDAVNKKVTIEASKFDCQGGLTTATYKTVQVSEGAILDSNGNGVWDVNDTQTSDITIKAPKAATVASVLTTLYVEAPVGATGDALRASLANVGNRRSGQTTKVNLVDAR